MFIAISQSPLSNQQWRTKKSSKSLLLRSLNQPIFWHFCSKKNDDWLSKQLLTIQTVSSSRWSLFWQVLEWPTPVRKGLGQMEGPSINSVAMDPELHFLVALSDKNMVIVWKREEASWATEEDIEVSLMFLYTDFFVLVGKNRWVYQMLVFVRSEINRSIDRWWPHFKCE